MGRSCTNLGMGSYADILAEQNAHANAVENQRLRDLYENAVGNRERFGWTINHLLECEEALRTVENRAGELEALLREAYEDDHKGHDGPVGDLGERIYAALNSEVISDGKDLTDG